MSKETTDAILTIVIVFLLLGGTGVIGAVLTAPFRSFQNRSKVRELEAQARIEEAKAKQAEAQRMTYKQMEYRQERKTD